MFSRDHLQLCQSLDDHREIIVKRALPLTSAYLGVSPNSPLIFIFQLEDAKCNIYFSMFYCKRLDIIKLETLRWVSEVQKQVP